MRGRRITPGRQWYAVAVLVFMAGATAFGWSLFKTLSNLSGSLTQVVVPGQKELQLSESGRYTIFHEYQSVVDNKVYSMANDGISGLRCRLRDEASGEEINLLPSAMNSSYSMGSRAGASLFDFNIEKPGTYILSARYSSQAEGPEVVLAVGHGFQTNLLATIFTNIALLFATLGATAAIVIITYIKREQAISRAANDQDH